MNEAAQKPQGNHDDHEYHSFLRRLQARFERNTDSFTQPLFRVDVPDLWEHYLDCFSQQERQFHNCSACRRFIREAGALVTIFPDGAQRAAFWDPDDAPDPYRLSVAAVAQAVASALVTGPYKTQHREIGQPITGDWRHMALVVPKPGSAFVHVPGVLTARQRMAEMREDYKSVVRALGEFALPTLATALNLLKTDALYRAEKVLGACQWLFDLQTMRDTAKSQRRKDNLVWLAIATAPQGFCHPRSGVIGTLLEDIQAGLPYKEFAAKFKAKMHPLVYQRPQSPPKAGNIQASEKLVAKLGIAPSLRRRYARLEELDTLWVARSLDEDVVVPRGVFSDVAPRDAKPKQKPVEVSAKPITWRKFSETVLPTADSISLRVPALGAFAAYTTASDPSAPPILQWDSEEQRNPMDWYQFSGGSLPAQWNLAEGAWVTVHALSHLPCLWHRRELYKHFGQGVLFVLEDCRQLEVPGLCLFPESLKSDLHSMRKTLEAYSRANKIEDAEQATACGVLLQPNSSQVFPAIRVVTGTHVAQYKIDRWD